MDSTNQKPFFYFKIFMDYPFRSIVHPKLDSSSIEIFDSIIEKNNKNQKLREDKELIFIEKRYLSICFNVLLQKFLMKNY